MLLVALVVVGIVTTIVALRPDPDTKHFQFALSGLVLAHYVVAILLLLVLREPGVACAFVITASAFLAVGSGILAALLGVFPLFLGHINPHDRNALLLAVFSCVGNLGCFVLALRYTAAVRDRITFVPALFGFLLAAIAPFAIWKSW
ncbi:MAG TPA: hypothetical protein VKB26_00280 [Candidatus Acidoferrales bacterium]|nr:hypothetical protein [Candidatus Acidoferrales bacterium]